MRHAVLFGSLVVAAIVAIACGSPDPGTLGAWGAPGNADQNAPDGAADQGGSDGGSFHMGTQGSDAGSRGGIEGGAGTGGFTGLPCDVQKILEDGCIGCHGGSQAPRLLTYADLTASSSAFPGQTVAQRSLARIKSTTSAMPPPPALAPTAAEIATFSAWVSGGTPKGTQCTTLGDGGVPDGGGGNPYNTPLVCTSGKTWNGDTSGLMDPGRACLDCHQKQGGPRFAVGGTVYPTAHEPDNCYGVPGNLSVVITDKNGLVTTLAVGATGNFYSQTAIVPPFTAKVTDGVKTRAMIGSLTAGDCNQCHTATGTNGAPGRIMAP